MTSKTEFRATFTQDNAFQ